MGIDIEFRGRYRGGFLRKAPSGDALLDSAAELAEGWWGGELVQTQRSPAGQTPAHLLLLAHPAAPHIVLSVPERGVICFEARTNTVGPGYHAAVCDFLKALSQELRIDWIPKGKIGSDEAEVAADETGYFESGDFNALREEMVRWFEALARIPRAELDEGTAICMPLSSEFDCAGRIVTPMGAQPVTWFDAILADPEREAKAFFCWWNKAKDADYYLKRALHLMHCNIRWQRPLTQADAHWQADAVRCLREAYKRDASLKYPWREWLELLQWNKESEAQSKMVADRARSVPDSQARIGLRRETTTFYDQGEFWKFKAPGRLSPSEAESDEGTTTFVADGLTVHLSTYSCKLRVPPEDAPKEHAKTLRKLCPDGQNPIFEVVESGIYRIAVPPQRTRDESTGEYWFACAGAAATPTAIAMMTVMIDAGSSDERSARVASSDIIKSLQPYGAK